MENAGISCSVDIKSPQNAPIILLNADITFTPTKLLLKEASNNILYNLSDILSIQTKTKSKDSFLLKIQFKALVCILEFKSFVKRDLVKNIILSVLSAKDQKNSKKNTEEEKEAKITQNIISYEDFLYNPHLLSTFNTLDCSFEMFTTLYSTSSFFSNSKTKNIFDITFEGKLNKNLNFFNKINYKSEISIEKDGDKFVINDKKITNKKFVCNEVKFIDYEQFLEKDEEIKTGKIIFNYNKNVIFDQTENKTLPLFILNEEVNKIGREYHLCKDKDNINVKNEFKNKLMEFIPEGICENEYIKYLRGVCSLNEVFL